MPQTVPGVYTLPLEFEFMDEKRTITPVAIETEHGVILVDVGLEDHADTIESHLAKEGFGFEDVETIIITHQDADHAGGLSGIKARSQATVVAHVDDAPYISGSRNPIKGDGDDRYSPEPIDIEVVDGVAFRTNAGKLRVIATPGHTPGHISLYLPDEKLLLAADALTAEDEFGGPNQDFTPDLDAAIASIKRLSELEVEQTICYHGGLIEHAPDKIKSIHKSLTK